MGRFCASTLGLTIRSVSMLVPGVGGRRGGRRPKRWTRLQDMHEGEEEMREEDGEEDGGEMHGAAGEAPPTDDESRGAADVELSGGAIRSPRRSA